MNFEHQELCNTIERSFVGVEKTLNVCGMLPPLSIASGLARGTLGSLQLSTGLVATLGIGLAAIGSDAQEDYEEGVECAERAFLYAIHGTGNITRGAAEVVMLLAPLLLLYDMTSRLEYPFEGEEECSPVITDMQPMHL